MRIEDYMILKIWGKEAKNVLVPLSLNKVNALPFCLCNLWTKIRGQKNDYSDAGVCVVLVHVAEKT